eukprot:TRINITY_DN1234_c0_g4_i2.p1 TRINITY_DN1234_c0_g4~~TRINITY_DN1234_c0_g4_i2.p1  ORF type:complete len:675 (+),score=103.49 TRINITY_DN1234_c0_g4_i2:209-2233(+)
MVSFMRGRCSPDQSTGCFGVSKTDSQKGQWIKNSSDNYSSFTSHCSSLASPRVVQQKSITFDNMMTFIQGISAWELNGWSTQKIWQFIKYLVDRLENAKAYKGYFSSFLQVLDVLNNYLADQKRRGQGLVRGKKRHDLVIALMCVQALNKAYGRRGDIKASCYILAKKVAEDFEFVSTLLTDAIYRIDSTIKLRRTDFIVPRDSNLTNQSLLQSFFCLVFPSLSLANLFTPTVLTPQQANMSITALKQIGGIKNSIFFLVMFLLVEFGMPTQSSKNDIEIQKYFQNTEKIGERNQYDEQQSIIFRKLLQQDNIQQIQNVDYMSSFMRYQEAAINVKVQDERVKAIYEAIQKTKTSLTKFMQEVKKQQKNFNTVILDTEIIDLLDNSQQIQEIRDNFIKADKQFQSATKNYTLVALELQEQQQEFEQQLKYLQKQEQNLTDIQRELQFASANLFMVTQFNITEDFISQNYMKPKKIPEDKLVPLLHTGVLRNVVVDLGTQAHYKDLNISKPTKIQKVQVTNTKKAVNHLRVNFLTEDSSLLIEDSKFFDLELQIEGNKNSNDVTIKNVLIENSPEHGLSIRSVKTCQIEEITVQNSTNSGIFLENVDDCTVENATVEDAGNNGLFFNNKKAHIKNSSFLDSERYGILVAAGNVTGENVIFKNNVDGDSDGNFVAK